MADPLTTFRFVLLEFTGVFHVEQDPGDEVRCYHPHPGPVDHIDGRLLDLRRLWLIFGDGLILTNFLHVPPTPPVLDRHAIAIPRSQVIGRLVFLRLVGEEPCCIPAPAECI